MREFSCMTRLFVLLPLLLALAAPAGAQEPAPASRIRSPKGGAGAKPGVPSPKAARAPKPIRCSTPGDALGAADLSFAGGRATLNEEGMDGSKSKRTAEATKEQIDAVVSGGGRTFIFKTANSNELGGAISEATLFVVGPRDPKARREGHMARGGTVYVLNCSD
jgi:hypothetical protein